MAVKCKLSILMKVKRYKMKDIFEKTGLARTTISNLYHDKATRINYETINKLCDLFDCKIEDLVEYTKDDEGKNEKSQNCRRQAFTE